MILVDINKEICKAWDDLFGNEPDMVIVHGRFETVRIGNGNGLIMTAAGNSYGMMTGGIDLAIAKFFPGVKKDVKYRITKYFGGEVNVGSAVYVPLDYPFATPYVGLIYPPTMRVPANIVGTDNVYKATRAALKLAKEYAYDKIELVMPGFGGACGQVPPKSIAKQMYLAYKNSTTVDSMQEAHNINAEILAATRLK